MIPINEFQEIADELALELPPVFYEQLNGGILLLEQYKLHEKSNPAKPLYVLGEYTYSGAMGRYIAIYYGSFARVFEGAGKEDLKNELRMTIRHEFRHHMESLAGSRDLEVEDHEKLAAYRHGTGQEP
jgi:hypothetical protein